MELIEPALVAAFAAVSVAASSSCCARLAIVFVSSFAFYVLLPPHCTLLCALGALAILWGCIQLGTRRNFAVA